MILCDRTLRAMLPQFVGVGLYGNAYDPDAYDMINPASIDIRVGYHVLREHPEGGFDRVTLSSAGFVLGPGDFALVETYELLKVPNGYAMEVRLKSTMARLGLDLALAIWFDPGWEGVGTLELKNNRRFGSIELKPEQRIAQVMIHKLDGESERPYAGRYNHARGVEGAKL